MRLRALGVWCSVVLPAVINEALRVFVLVPRAADR